MGILDGDSPFKDNPVALFIVQLIFILLLSRIFGKALKFVKQPFVIGEMIAGIFLGPSVFGLSDTFTNIFFPTESVVIIKVLAYFGLILFMFLIGLEIDYTIFKKTVRRFAIISSIGVVIPFLCSIPVAYLLFNRGWEGEAAVFGNFLLFLGVALGITTLPVLARILADRQMLKAPLGVASMSAAAVDDLEGWILLAIVIAIARAEHHLNILWTLLLAVANLLGAIFVVRPIFNRIAKKVEDTHQFSNDVFFLIITVLFAYSWFAEIIGLSSIFGAFEVGIVVPRTKRVVEGLITRLEDITKIVFSPLYFTLSGLRTRFGLVNTGEAWGIFVLIFVVSFVSKVVGCAISAKLIGRFNWKESVCFGILAQTKGTIALIIFNLGLDYKVISERMFAVGILMVLLSTISTTPLVELIYPLKKMMKETLEKKQKDSTFSILLCANNTKSAQSLVTCAVPLVEGRTKYSYVVDVINVVENSGDEGGSVTTWFLQKKLKFNKVARAAKSQARGLGIKLFTKVLMNDDISGQIQLMADAQGSDLILLATDTPETPGLVIKEVQRKANCDVGVLVVPQEKKLPRINKVLCSLLRTKNDSYVVKYATMIAHSQQTHLMLLHFNKKDTVTNLDEVNEYTNIATKFSSMKYKNLAVDDTYETTQLESEKDRYDLIVVGADENQKEQIEWIKKQNCCTLIIYGTQKVKKPEKKGKSEEEDIELRMSIEKM